MSRIHLNRIASALAAVLFTSGAVSAEIQVGTTFTYQGLLEQNGTPVEGGCCFDVGLWTAADQSGALLASWGQCMNIIDGLLEFDLDFGADAFKGKARWLEIAVCCDPDDCSNPPVNYTVLSPRQGLTPTPYALALPGMWTHQNDSSPSVIGGYSGNGIVGQQVIGATIGGGGASGAINQVTNSFGTVAGGSGNVAGGSASTVPGGSGNTAAGDFSLAAGHRAKAEHHGSFVWADSADEDFTSTNTNQFLVRASGGVGIGVEDPSTALDVLGTVTASALRTSSTSDDATILYHNTTESAPPNDEGFRIRHVNGYFFQPGQESAGDALVFEKTGGGFPGEARGGFVFVNTDVNGIEEVMMALRGDGFVEIGTAVHSVSLLVAGGAQVENNLHVGDKLLGNKIYGNLLEPLELGADLTTSIYIESGSGEVGIGTVTPNNTLDVDGTVHATRGALGDYGFLDANVRLEVAGWFQVSDTSGTEIATFKTESPYLAMRGAGWPDSGSIFIGNNTADPSVMIRPSTNTAASSVRIQNKSGTQDIAVFRGDGKVGIGTTTPSQKLTVYDGEFVLQTDDNSEDQSILFLNSGANYTWRIYRTDAKNAQADFRIAGGDNNTNYAGLTDRLTITKDGYVGIGNTDPDAALVVRDQSGGAVEVKIPNGGLCIDSDGACSSAGVGSLRVGDGGIHGANSSNNDLYLVPDVGNVGIGTTTPGARLDVDGTTRTTILQITGGADIAEPFEVHGSVVVKPGMVVAIDPDSPGELRVADRPYSRTVAGVISGANGIRPGMTLQQNGTVADGSHPVALTGRVWCYCDADAGGPIKPGDLLTTSATPGYAMKVTDFDRAPGSVLGKAMTPLNDGRGFVLLLVSLQ